MVASPFGWCGEGGGIALFARLRRAMPVGDRRSPCRARFTRVWTTSVLCLVGVGRLGGVRGWWRPRLVGVVRAGGLRFSPASGGRRRSETGAPPVGRASRGLDCVAALPGWSGTVGRREGMVASPSGWCGEGGGIALFARLRRAMPVGDRRSPCRARFTRVGLRRCSAWLEWDGWSRGGMVASPFGWCGEGGGIALFARLRRAMPVGDRRSPCRARFTRVWTTSVLCLFGAGRWSRGRKGSAAPRSSPDRAIACQGCASLPARSTSRYYSRPSRRRAVSSVGRALAF